MPRNLPTQLLNNLQGKKIKIAFLVKIFLEQNNKILLTTHSRNIIYQNEEYLFAKNLLVEGIDQTQKLQNQETQLSLTGIPDSFIVNGQTIYTTNLLLSTKFAGKQVLVYQAYFDLITDQLIIDPTLLTDGIIISSSFADGINENMEVTGTTSISLPFGNEFARFEDKNAMYTNPSSHKRLFANDRIFDQVPALASKVFEFGKL